MMLVERTVASFLEELRSSAPTPGGGSAAALAGAMGSSLLVMVAALPKPRAEAPEDLAKLDAARQACDSLARQLERLVDADTDAYRTVVAAYKLPKATDEEKRARSARIQEALKTAVEAPRDVMRACASALTHVPVLATLGNPNASSDVGVGAALLRAAIRSARLNVEINLDSMKDTGYVDAVRADIRQLALSESDGTDDPSARS